MAKVEVDEEDIRSANRLRATVQKILADPKAKLLVQQAHKMVDPTAITPELDQTQQIAAPIADVTKQLNDLRAERLAEKQEREDEKKLAKMQSDIDAGLNKLRSQGWTDEGLEGVQKIMREKALLDPMDAAAIFEKQHPPQNPVHQQGSGAWNFMESPADGDADLKRLIETRGESESLVTKMAYEALNEVRGTPRR